MHKIWENARPTPAKFHTYMGQAEAHTRHEASLLHVLSKPGNHSLLQQTMLISRVCIVQHYETWKYCQITGKVHA